MSDADRPSIDEQSPSAKLVYTALKYQGSQTQKQLIEETLLSPRTIRYALNDLMDADLVMESTYFPDARQSLYELTDEVSTPQSEGETERLGQTAPGPSDDW